MTESAAAGTQYGAQEGASAQDPRLKEFRARKRLKDDLPFFAQTLLKIRTKNEGLQPLNLNREQAYVHAKLEDQRKRKGRVRALILKPRQRGISTYIGARGYSKATHTKGYKVMVLAHKEKASKNLYTMVKRFYEHSPQAFKPMADTKNANRMEFGALDSGFEVATAGGTEVGRSDTIQFVHWSETAFCENAQMHMDSLIDAVPDAEGTEIIMESTGNGVGGVFYNLIQEALKGESEYEVIFFPWFWAEDYRKEVPEGWTPPATVNDKGETVNKWLEYAELHDLDDEQLYWAYTKSATKAQATRTDPSLGPYWKFRQEYPATVEEAFQTSGEGGIISVDAIMRARRAELPDPPASLPIILGFDPNARGGDLSWIISRQGRVLGRHWNKHKKTKTLQERVGMATKALDATDADMMFIDAGNGGSDIYDVLCELGYEERVMLVDFAGAPDNDNEYLNKRAEMYGGARDWINDPGGADIPNDDLLHMHLSASREKERTTDRKLQVEEKKGIVKRVGFSPDGADATVLTFAFPVEKRTDRYANTDTVQVISDYDELEL